MLELPSTCPTYYGKHTMACLKTVWDLVGCLLEGHEFPEKLSHDALLYLSELDYRFSCLHAGMYSY